MRLTLMTLLIFFTIIQTVDAFEIQKSIKAVAVTSGDEPKGAVINITVMINSGNGRVFVSTTPFTEIDMQGSTQLSAITACDLLGIDFTKFDFFYIIEADAPIVGGPSAGAVMTVATLAALKNLELDERVYMSGMIYPDGFIGPVGGLNYKLDAVARNGGKIFLVPSGQSVINVEERTIRRVGIINIITTELRELNLVDYGKKLGIEVIEVKTVNEALRYYTGYEIVRQEREVNITIYSDILKVLADRMREGAAELQNYATKEARDLLNRAEQSYKSGNYYTSTSEFFQAKILMRYEMFKKTLASAQQIDREIETIESEISRLKEYLKSEQMGVNSIQIIAGAQERVAEAEKALKKAKIARSEEDILYNLAYAKERVESAKVWLSLLPQMSSGQSLNNSEIKRRAEFYINQASSIIVYASSLEGYTDLLQNAFESLEISKSLYSESLYAGAAFEALNAITDASLSIEVKYGEIASKVEERKRNAKIAIGEAEETCYPILPIAYFEYAETSKSVYAKLLYYSLSERIAKFMSNVAKTKGEREVVHRGYVDIKPTTPETRESIREILEIPGFEIAISLFAILILTYKIRKK
ncbi:MAG: S16 family serine protease [Archaeoglobaceae archaeon]|nr:serine protease-like protein [Archaeoglobaceae archaeon]MDW7990101.1 S16 family serine protease [Archaeoglobaceae archaeon]